MSEDLSCTFDSSEPTRWPFQYRNINGSFVTTGKLVDSICVFETAACASTETLRFDNGSAFSCCGITDELDSAAQVWFFPMIGFFVPYLTITILGRWAKARQAAKKRQLTYKQQGMPGKPGGAEDDDARAPTDGETGHGAWAACPRDASSSTKVVIAVVYLAAIGALVGESTIMPKSIQQNLSPADRSAQLAMTSFLEPVKEIFAFIEDSMVVQVGYALAARRYADLNALLHISVLGGAFSGAVAFILAVVLAMDDVSAAAILNPSARTNADLIAAGCSLVPTTEILLSKARPYWVLIAASWIPSFVIKGLLGFFAGTGDMAIYAAPLLIQAIVPVGIWFGVLGSHSNLAPMTTLGLAYGTGPWLVTLCFFIYLACRHSLRARYQLRCLVCRCGGGGGGGGAVERVGLWATARSVISEGLLLMCVDLSVQLSITITIYVAASDSFEAAYKIAAAQAAYWNFGPQYLVGTFIFLKVIGAQLIASGKARQFVFTFGASAIFTVSMAVSAVVASELKGLPVAYDYGESACIFASNSSCVSAYAEIFSGKDDLSAVFNAFGPIVGLQLIFMLSRAGLAMCHDFAFMAKASSSTFLVVFIPSILIAHYAFDKSTVALYISMYLPHFAMIVVFAVRMYGHLKSLWHGRPGPWTSHARRLSAAGTSNRELLLDTSSQLP